MLQEYIRREVKPKSKQELVDGIRAFWKICNHNQVCEVHQQLEEGYTRGHQAEWSSHRILIGSFTTVTGLCKSHL